MRIARSSLLLLGSVLALSSLACASETTAPGVDDVGAGEDDLTSFTPAKAPLTIAYGASSDHVDLAGKTDIRGVAFDGTQGDDVDIWVMFGENLRAWLIAPNGTTTLATNDDAGPWTKHAHIRFRLTKTGKHYIAFRDVYNGPSFAVAHVEKIGAPAPALTPVATKDPCLAHPWPMEGQCREQLALASAPGPVAAPSRAWSTAYRWTKGDSIARAVVSRDGSVHLLHGVFDQLRRSNTLVFYTVIGPDGVKRSSTRVPIEGSGPAMGIALAAEGTAWAMTSDGAVLRADALGEMQLATSFPAREATGWGPLLQIDPQGHLLGRVRPADDQVRVLDPVSLFGTVETMLNPQQTTLNQAVRPSKVPLPGGDTIVQVSRTFENTVSRLDAAGKTKWTRSGMGLLGVDPAHGRLYVADGRNQLAAVSLDTGNVEWAESVLTVTHPKPTQLLIHKSGDVVVTSSTTSPGIGTRATLWGFGGAKKGELPTGTTEASFVLDAAGTTYVAAAGHLQAMSASGAKLFDVPDDAAYNQLVAGPNRTLYLVGKELVAYRP